MARTMTTGLQDTGPLVAERWSNQPTVCPGV